VGTKIKNQLTVIIILANFYKGYFIAGSQGLAEHILNTAGLH